ncbi:hypothetical protein AFLA_008842 [Aspergillus flavus NRRL3357]|nr:hypothetical protein AFLA_008842 [Aspergillus flavus NRRL3357]
MVKSSRWSVSCRGCTVRAHSHPDWTASSVRRVSEQVVNLHLYTAGMLYPPVLFADIVALGPVQLYARPCTRQMILRMYTHRPAKQFQNSNISLPSHAITRDNAALNLVFDACATI